jgi:chloramphenicol-sensitive protein RarD
MLTTDDTREIVPRDMGIAALAFMLLGLMSIYMSLLSHIECSLILLFRNVWVVITLLPYLLLKSDFKLLFAQVKRFFPYLLLSTTAVAINWLCFIYAVNNNHIFETSLAYYISPVISVLLAFIVLREPLTPRQIITVILISLAIAYLLIVKGVLPQYALLIAGSFAFYGFISKSIPIEPFERMAIENLLMSFIFFFIIETPAGLFTQFISYDSTTQLVLAFLGLTTVVTTGLYIVSSDRLQFALVGVLSFILPTVVFVVGIFYFEESIDIDKGIVISLIWSGVAFWIYDLLVRAHKVQSTVPSS